MLTRLRAFIVAVRRALTALFVSGGHASGSSAAAASAEPQAQSEATVDDGVERRPTAFLGVGHSLALPGPGVEPVGVSALPASPEPAGATVSSETGVPATQADKLDIDFTTSMRAGHTQALPATQSGHGHTLPAEPRYASPLSATETSGTLLLPSSNIETPSSEPLTPVELVPDALLAAIETTHDQMGSDSAPAAPAVVPSELESFGGHETATEIVPTSDRGAHDGPISLVSPTPVSSHVVPAVISTSPHSGETAFDLAEGGPVTVAESDLPPVVEQRPDPNAVLPVAPSENARVGPRTQSSITTEGGSESSSSREEFSPPRRSPKVKTPPGLEGPQSSREPPQEWSHPFAGPIGDVPTIYSKWNRAILQNALQANAADSDLLLSITPRVLAGAWLESEGEALTPEEASGRFSAAVSAAYSTRVLAHRARLQTLRRYGDGGLPECAAFLALTVLAAYEMHAEEGVGATAYYQRLEQLLRSGMAGGVPRGFDGEQFEGLWMFFGAWLLERYNQRLAMPGSAVGLRRFVALPLTHVPLRRVDIERLPDFFDWAGLGPGERVAPDRIRAALGLWARARGGFTVAGTEALRDDRRAAVLAQIAHELECWDGSLTDASGGHAATVEVFLNWERRVPCLWYLARRPAAFPVTFDDGERVLDSGHDGWYEPVPLEPGDGTALRDGLSWRMIAGSDQFILQRTGAQVLALTPSEFDGPISHGSLVLGASCAVMCVDETADRVARHLEAITGKRSLAVNAASVPIGWRLFTNVVPVRRVEPPAGLDSLAIRSAIEVVPRGGLRLGRRWSWLVGAPPTLVVTGLEGGEAILLNDESVQVSVEGVVQDEGRLSHPGVHVLQARHVVRRIEILEPQNQAFDSQISDSRRQHAAALPPGKWIVLGARPGDVAYATSGRYGAGAFAVCSFEPMWAVSYSGGPGAVVISLSPLQTGPDTAETRSRERVKAATIWANTIHGAQVRRPVFLSAAPEIDATLQTRWLAYVGAAKGIKRILKATQR